MKKKNKVSVIITTKNEGAVIENLLKSLLRQTYQNIEILLVDNYSSDNTQSIAKKYKEVHIFQHGPERSAQRNFGVKQARGKCLLFLDADMELTPDVVLECVEVMDKSKNTGGIIIPEQSVAKRFWEKVKAFERSFYNLEGDSVTDAARFFTKSAFEDVGGYDETITGPEDWDLPENIRKKGYQIVRITSVIRHHERIKNLFSLMKKKYYYGLQANSYLKKHKVPVISPKTIYFLRPIFYKNWQKLILNPFMTLAMFYMLFMELLSGGFGFMLGRFIYERQK